MEVSCLAKLIGHPLSQRGQEMRPLLGAELQSMSRAWRSEDLVFASDPAMTLGLPLRRAEPQLPHK